MFRVSYFLVVLACGVGFVQSAVGQQWSISSQEDWLSAAASSDDFSIQDGWVAPQQDEATFASSVQSFSRKQSFDRIEFGQSGLWGSSQWNDAGNLGPTDERDAPVFVSPSDGDYWYFNAVNGGREYHAWHSTDMVNWSPKGNVTGEQWVTSAEYKHEAGKLFVYYDEPNDDNPHLMTFDVSGGSLTNRSNIGMVLDTNSHGSDMAAFRDLDGSFHIIYEDWMAINARQHSWDSQYAGHTSSGDGINGFTAHEHTPVIDLRGNDTGQDGSYVHPVSGTHIYDIHDGSLDAFGDYELIRVGDKYYLFSDYHPEGGDVGLGYWMSDSLNEHFEFGGAIRTDFHPDPAVGFAEGEFVMFVQGSDDFSSSGPWADGVDAKVGVDEDGDGSIDHWTDWSKLTESYDRIDGFAKAFSVDAASIDLSELPDGYGIQFMFRTTNRDVIMSEVNLFSTPAAVPEPASTGLMVAVSCFCCLYRRRCGLPVDER